MLHCFIFSRAVYLGLTCKMMFQIFTSSFCYPSQSIWDFSQMYGIKVTPISIWKMAALAHKKAHNRLKILEQYLYLNRF